MAKDEKITLEIALCGRERFVADRLLAMSQAALLGRWDNEVFQTVAGGGGGDPIGFSSRASVKREAVPSIHVGIAGDGGGGGSWPPKSADKKQSPNIAAGTIIDKPSVVVDGSGVIWWIDPTPFPGIIRKMETGS